MNTTQEQAWAGEHGNAYNRRAPGNEEANYQLFRHINDHNIPRDNPPKTILELGAGTGANLRAMARVWPRAHLGAVELNRQACEAIRTTTPAAMVVNASVLEVDLAPDVYDLVLTKGLLIHIHPDKLEPLYERIHSLSARWILLAEYYNPVLVNVPYRGRDDLLWKGDYAGAMLGRFPDLELVDYGFVYRRDRFPQDDITWFLLEKR